MTWRSTLSRNVQNRDSISGCAAGLNQGGKSLRSFSRSIHPKPACVAWSSKQRCSHLDLVGILILFIIALTFAHSFVTVLSEAMRPHEVANRLICVLIRQANNRARCCVIVAQTAELLFQTVFRICHGLSMLPDPTALGLLLRRRWSKCSRWARSAMAESRRHATREMKGRGDATYVELRFLGTPRSGRETSNPGYKRQALSDRARPRSVPKEDAMES